MFRKATAKLTIQYSLLIIGILGLFSVGLYQWVDNLLDKNYIQEVEHRLGSNDDLAITTQQHKTVEAAAEVAVEQFRAVLLVSDAAALIGVPFVSYAIARRSIRPLVAANESQKRFITNASHELRTPLAVIGGEFELALKRDRDNNYYKKTILSTKEEIDRLNRVTNQLLELQRIESHSSKLSIDAKAVSVNDFLANVVSINKKFVTTHHLTIELQPDPDANYIVVNETLIHTAMNNLISNAVKYSKAKTVVTVGAEMKNNTVSIYVDNQPKIIMTSEDKDQIFERFFQPKEELKKNGFGLGLAIVKAIMEAHRGRVMVETHGDKLRFRLSFK